MDSLQTKTKKLLKYGKTKLSEKGVESTATDLRGVLDDIGNIEVQPTLQEKTVTITENGTTEVVADSGYDGLAKVNVETNVQGGGGNQVKELIEGTITEIVNSDVTTVRQYCFYNAKALTKADFQNATRIEDRAFYNCSSLTSINTPNITNSIGMYAFSGCSSLTSITIPEGVTGIGGNAFYNCSKLTNIIIPNSVTTIGSYAFMGCKNFTSITIPDSVKAVYSNTFRSCSSLTSITIGKGVTQIAGYAFYACTVLSTVDFRSAAQVPTLSDNNAFTNVPTTCKFIIPDNLYDSWIASTNWVSLYNKGYQFIKASEYTEA